MRQPEGDRSIMALADLATPMAIRVAATLSLVEHAGVEGATAHELAARSATVPQALQRLLGHLVAVGVFDLDAATGRYRPTDLGAQMHEDAPQGVKPLLDITCAGGRGELAFVDLLETVTTGVPAYLHRYGREFWADLDASPRLRRSFDAQMNWRFREQAPQIAANFDWSRYPDIVDVGGGDGALLIEILRAHPDVRGGSSISNPLQPRPRSGSPRWDWKTARAPSPAAFSTRYPTAPTPICSATSCMTGTTSTANRS